MPTSLSGSGVAAGEVLEQQVAYWRGRLRVACLDLPTTGRVRLSGASGGASFACLPRSCRGR